MKKIVYTIAIFAVLLFGCHKDDDVSTEPQPQPVENETITLNVDVVLPANIQKQWQNTINWALDNINKSQQTLQRKVKLNLRYHDEDTEDLDALGYRLANPQEGDDTCHAIIGPYHSTNATNILRYARKNRLPVIMPTCTSAELQRTNAKNTYAWFLTESDITQCEIMISAAKSLKATDVALIYSDDTYGQSFRDWFGYYATEKEINIAGGSYAYKKGDDNGLLNFLSNVCNEAQGDNIKVLVALSNAGDYAEVCNTCVLFDDDDEEEDEESGYFKVKISTICSDTSLDDELFENSSMLGIKFGVCPSASMVFGFPQAYKGFFDEYPLNGEAQVYDALCIIALGAAKQAASPDQCIVDGNEVKYNERPYNATLTDYMRCVVSCDEGITTQWDDDGLSVAFGRILQGLDVSITGATGAMYFDSDTHTKMLNTSYMLWRPNPDVVFEYDEEDDGETDFFTKIFPVLYMTTDAAGGGVATNYIWQLDKAYSQTFDENYEQHTLPEKTDNWAVVVSPSTTWSNYRHQADAFAMYQLLRSYGYDEDHIVLIVEDNLYNAPKNVFPGQIFVERGDGSTSATLVNDDVRAGAVVDYHFSDLTPDDIADIMLGNQSERLPKVITPTETSNVFFFWSGHGGSREGPLWGNEDATQYFGTNRIKNIVSEMNSHNMYRRMMFAIETCYSGKWGEALEGQPDVLVLTAANPNEYSMADVHDRDLGVYLSNAFARTFRNAVTDNPSISVYDLYRNLFRTTIGSHVSLYNQKQYGSVYTETMEEFFGE